MIATLKKYFFSLIVVSYLSTTMGVPVYLHYCGGELEKVSYLIKGESCCGSDDDAAMPDDGCCKDESYIINAQTDFTFKQADKLHPVIAELGLLWTTHPSFVFFPERTSNNNFICDLWPPPNIQNKIISTSVLRI